MLYQITNKRRQKIKKLHVLVIAPDSKDVIFNKVDISFIYDMAKRCNISWFSVELMHINTFEKEQFKYPEESWVTLDRVNHRYSEEQTNLAKITDKKWEDYYYDDDSGQRLFEVHSGEFERSLIEIEYEKLSDVDQRIYDEKIHTCQYMIEANQSVVLIIYGYRKKQYEDNEQEERDGINNSAIHVLLSMLNEIGYKEKANVQIIISDNNVKADVPSWFVNKLVEVICETRRSINGEREYCNCPYNKQKKNCESCEWHIVEDGGNNKKDEMMYCMLEPIDSIENMFLKSVVLPKLHSEEENDAITQDLKRKLNACKNDILIEMNKKQDILDKMKNDLCLRLGMSISNHAKTSEVSAAENCHVTLKTWKKVFTVKETPTLELVYAVAIGMRMNTEEFKTIMAINGYISQSAYRLRDAIIETFISCYDNKNKKEQTIEKANAVLTMLNQKALNLRKIKEPKK